MAQGVAQSAQALDHSLAQRIDGLDWVRIRNDIKDRGFATTGPILSANTCRMTRRLYDDDTAFRSRVVMARHSFGSGEYKYFTYPLPGAVEAMRTALYPHLAGIANGWRAMVGDRPDFPADHADFLHRCHAAGQTQPTPLLLRYVEGDYNCLHQDLYGAHCFPLQVIVQLSEPGTDFTGGELVVTEQRPRMQSRAEVLPLSRGDAAVLAVSQRPRRGRRGDHRVTMRHGISRVRSGERMALGIIFHDAA